MKIRTSKISFLTCLFLAFSASCFCQEKVTLSGTITNPKGNKVFIKRVDDIIVYRKILVDSATLDADGNFTMTFDWDYGNRATFEHGNEYALLYLSPGDNLKLTLHTKYFDESLVFTGQGSVVNNYKAIKRYRYKKSIRERRFATELPEQIYMRFSDSVLLADLNFLKSYQLKQVNMTKQETDFFKKERNVIQYDWIRERLYYPEFHGMYNKKPPVRPGKDFADPVLRILSEKQADTLNPYYLKATWSYTEYLSVIASIDNPELEKLPYSMQKYRVACEGKKGRARTYQQSVALHDALSFENDFETVEKALPQYLADAKNYPEYVTVINQTYKRLVTLREGNAAPDFVAITPDDKPVSLSSFKGKVVYLDVWASWCGGCIADLPELKKLKQDFANHDVVFLNISLDKSEAEWRKALQKHGIEGNNALAKGEFSSDLATNYAISAIPQYLLIDRDGKIISINAGRPGRGAREEIEEAFESKKE